MAEAFTKAKSAVAAATLLAHPWTTRQCRQLAYVAKFTHDIRHIAGTNNIVADTLSRPPPAALLVAARVDIKAPFGSSVASQPPQPGGSTGAMVVDYVAWRPDSRPVNKLSGSWPPLLLHSLSARSPLAALYLTL